MGRPHSQRVGRSRRRLSTPYHRNCRCVFSLVSSTSSVTLKFIRVPRSAELNALSILKQNLDLVGVHAYLR